LLEGDISAIGICFERIFAAVLTFGCTYLQWYMADKRRPWKARRRSRVPWQSRWQWRQNARWLAEKRGQRWRSWQTRSLSSNVLLCHAV